MGERLKKTALFLLCAALIGCGASKKEFSSSSSAKEFTETKKDSSTSIKVNKEINDKVSTQVTTTGDPVLDAKVDAILSSLNTQKSSGDNSYRFYYDAKLRELRAEFQVARTKDSVSNTNQSTKIEKTFEQQMSEYVKKIRVPWWVYLLGFILAVKILMPFLMFFFPQLRGLQTFRDVITPPHKPSP